MSRRPPIRFRLTEASIREELERYASSCGLTVSQAARRLVQEKLREMRSPQERLRRLEAATTSRRTEEPFQE